MIAAALRAAMASWHLCNRAVLGQHRSTQRKAPRAPDGEVALRGEIIALARLYGRYGYRRVTAFGSLGGGRIGIVAVDESAIVAFKWVRIPNSSHQQHVWNLHWHQLFA
jgi:hypothetical protein